MSLSGKWARLFFMTSSLMVLFFFQNCGKGFESNTEIPSSELSEGQDEDTPSDNSGGLPQYKGERSYTEFLKCSSNLNIGVGGAVECMRQNNIELGNLTQAMVNECAVTVGNSIPIDIAFCLSQKNVPLIGYRHLTQLDVEACHAAVGVNNVGTCLKNKGLIEFLPVSVLQSKVSSCIQGGGLENVEVCFRRNRDLPRNVSFTQYDIKLCSLIYGNSDELIKDCLENNEIWPSALTIDEFIECKTEVGFGAISACLRGKQKLGPVVLVQNYIERCIQAVGEANAGNCLLANKLLPEGTNPAEVTDCLARSRTQVPVCMANKRLIPRVMSQAHLDVCAKLNTESNLEECLRINGVLNGGITQSHISACSTATGDFKQVMKCLRFNQRRLPKAVMNADVVNCNRLVGQEGIWSCLNTNGFEVSNFAQEDIDNCVTANGLDSVANCLRTSDKINKVVLNAHIDSCRLHNIDVTNLNACLTVNGLTLNDNMTQVNFNTCETAVTQSRAPNIMTCLANNEWVTPIPSQEFFEACVDYVGVNSVEACLRGHGVLPPLTTQANIDGCVVANSGSFSAVIQCLQENNNIAPKLVDLLASGGVFANRCITCHSAGGVAVAAFDITVREQVLEKIDPGFSALASQSELMDRITSNVQGFRMPPNNNNALNATERSMVRYWILNGAQ